MRDVTASSGSDRPGPRSGAPEVRKREGGSEPGIESLLERMRAGDREAGAEFMAQYGPRLRRRICGKLSAPVRRIFDSQDLLSTVARRLDAFVRSGRLAATSEDQLWSLVFRIADHALADKARVSQRLRRAEGEDGPFARALLERMDREAAPGAPAAEIELARVFTLLDDSVDRTILSLWLADSPHVVTAEAVGLSAGAVRQRWGVIRARLRRALDGECAA